MMQGLLDMIDNGMKSRYNTQLNPVEQVYFNAWADKNNRANDAYDYDIQGAFRDLMSGQMTESQNRHLGDKYKKPNHPTFSNQSIYSTTEMQGGNWVGMDFQPSAQNLRNMPLPVLQDYFKKYEPQSRIIGLFGSGK